MNLHDIDYIQSRIRNGLLVTTSELLQLCDECRKQWQRANNAEEKAKGIVMVSNDGWYWAWADASKRSLEQKMADGMTAFQRRWGYPAAGILVNDAYSPSCEATGVVLGGVVVRGINYVPANVLWFEMKVDDDNTDNS